MVDVDSKDKCPSCGYNLGKQAFETNLSAGDEITCERCGAVFYLWSVSNGTQDWFQFLREDEC